MSERINAMRIAVQTMEWEGAPIPEPYHRPDLDVERMDAEGGDQIQTGPQESLSRIRRRTQLEKLNAVVAPTGSLGGLDIGGRVLDGPISTRNRLGSKESVQTQGTQANNFEPVAVAARGR